MPVAMFDGGIFDSAIFDTDEHLTLAVLHIFITSRIIKSEAIVTRILPSLSIKSR